MIDGINNDKRWMTGIRTKIKTKGPEDKGD